MLTSLRTFSKSYWRSAALELRSLRRLVFAALIAAITIVIGGLFIPVGENLRIYFTFLTCSVGCAIYGPLMGLLVGAATDTLNFIIFGGGAYFPGYLISEMLGNLIYALFLYRKRITVARLAGAKLIINVFVNIFLGSVWSAMLYSKGFYYYLGQSVIKNLVLLPVEIAVMAALFRLLIPRLSKLGALVPHDATRNKIIPWF